MKKLGLFKRIGLTTTAASLCVASLATSFVFATPVINRAYAEGSATGSAEQVTTTSVANIVENIAIKDNCKYGEDISIPTVGGTTVSVIQPNGDPGTITEGKVKANQVGVYKIRYTKDGASYDFKVKVTADDKYFLYVEDNGAGIPTYVDKSKKPEFTLPKAYVKYYDDDNVLKDAKADGINYDIIVKDSLGGSYDVTSEATTKNKFTATANGKVFITYSARLGGADGTKYYSEKFTVNVQNEVAKAGNPSIAVSGVQNTASINRPVTLPVAKVTDTSDDRPLVKIEVLEPDGTTNVKRVNVNDDGYAISNTADEVIFDNNKSMTFYPTKKGRYLVRYTAYNDSYDPSNPSSGGKSGTSEFSINVEDYVAPVFKKVEDNLIPDTWAKVVKNKAGDTLASSGKITFTVPEVVDNYDVVEPLDNVATAAEAANEKGYISLYFRVYDADYSRTIVSFENILYKPTTDDPAEDGTDFGVQSKYPHQFKANSVYTANATYSRGTPFVFDFEKYERKDAKGDPASTKAGTYTVLYRVRDKANNTATKSYTITYKDTYEDKAEPTEAKVTAPEYLAVADETFTIPYPEYADAADSRPTLVYRMFTDAAGAVTESNFIDVKGGEVADIVTENDKRYLVLDKDKDSQKKLLLGSKLYFYVGVTDKVGNFKSNTTNNKNEADVAADLGEIKDYVKVIGATSESNKLTYAGKIEFKNADTTKTEIVAGDTVNAGGFTIQTGNADLRAYTGFEVSVYDPSGNPIDFTLETVSVPYVLSDTSDVSKATIIVQNINFMVSSAATTDKPYSLYVRAFDVNGNSTVSGYKLSGVKAPVAGGGGQTSAVQTIGSIGEVSTKYKLNNDVIKGIPEGKYYVVRKITGRSFSLMGSEFVSKAAGSYTVKDGYIADDKIDKTDASFIYTDVNFGSGNKGVTNFDISDTAKPVIELQGVMPSYVKKFNSTTSTTASEDNGLVTIPKAVAYTANGNGVISVEVFYSSTLTGTSNEDVKSFDETAYTFVAEKDGKYTVKYTAVYGGSEAVSASYDIYAGDVTAPVFTLDRNSGTSTAGTKTEGERFYFKNIVLDSSEETKGVTIKKEIYSPSHELLSTHTVSGGLENYANKGDNGTAIVLNKVGDYEIVYTVTDAVGNPYQLKDKVTVTSAGSSKPTTWTTLSTVLIIVAVLLLAGVIIYVVRFRKVKK